MGGSWLALVFFGCVTVLTVGVLWFRVFRPMLEDFGLISAEGVKSYEVDYGEPIVKPLPARPADPSLSVGLSAPSARIHPALRAIMLDSEDDKGARLEATSRMALVQALVAAGWKTGEIRAQLKGDTGAIGDQVRAARIALGMADEEVPHTPIAGRPVPPGVEFAEEAV